MTRPVSGLDGLLEAVAAHLAPRLEGRALVTGEYPASRPGPPCVPVVAVGLDGLKADGPAGFLGEKPGEDGPALSRGRALELTLRFDIRGASQGECHRVFTLLCEALLLEECPLPVGALWCDGLVPERGSGLLTLTAKARAPALLSREDREGRFDDFMIRSVMQ